MTECPTCFIQYGCACVQIKVDSLHYGINIYIFLPFSMFENRDKTFTTHCLRVALLLVRCYLCLRSFIRNYRVINGTVMSPITH